MSAFERMQVKISSRIVSYCIVKNHFCYVFEIFGYTFLLTGNSNYDEKNVFFKRCDVLFHN